MTPLPVLGAAMRLDHVEELQPWLLEAPRDLELQDFFDASVLAGDWDHLVTRAARLLDGHTGRLGIHGPFIGLNVASGDPDVRAVVAKRMDQALAIAGALRADQIVIHSPYTTWMHNNLDNMANQRERMIDFAHQTLAGAVRRAEDQGCVFVLENIEDKDPSIRRILAESFESPAVRLSVDTGHAHYAALSTGAPPVDYFVQDAGDALEHVHLQDADGYADRHWPLGWGSINWRAVFAALGALRSNPRLILEIRDKSGILPSARHLSELGVAG